MTQTLQPSQQPAAATTHMRAGSGWSRDAVETRVFRVLRWVVIAFFLIISIFPFYYTVLLSLRALDQVVQNPGALFVGPGDWVFSSYQSVLESAESGGQGFLTFIRNSALVALGTVALTLLVAIPGAYAVSRLQFFGRRQISGLFLASTCSRPSCSPCRCSSSSPHRSAWLPFGS